MKVFQANARGQAAALDHLLTKCQRISAHFTVLTCVLFATLAIAMPPDGSSGPRLDNPAQNDMNPLVKAGINDCQNLLAFRLSLMEGDVNGPLEDCGSATFSSSPLLAAFDCTGLTANACAALYRTNLPHHYMSGGWNADSEMWYLPLARNVAGGNLCLDGTRQFVYADKAVAWQCSNDASACSTDADCGGGVCEARDIESNKWVFYTQGGSNCLTEQSCLDHYMAGDATTTTRGAPFGENSAGILSDDLRNPFHGHNRVRLRKCNQDGFSGNITRPSMAEEARPVVSWDNREVEVDLYFHGAREWLAAFDQLENGYANHREFYASCTSNSDCGAGDQCVTTAGGDNVFMCVQTKDLPPLQFADQIILAGWSGGATALSHTGDALVEHLQAGPQPLAPDANIYLAYDAAWKPGLQSDTAFWSGDRNMYLATTVPDVDSPGLLPPDADATIEIPTDAHFSSYNYVPGGETYLSHQLWGIQYDQSCVDMHGTESWHCHERQHVLGHHVTTPAFSRTAQRDANGTDKPGSGHMHSLGPCKQDQNENNCYDWVDEEYRQRAFQQSTDFYRDFTTLAEEGGGAPSRGVFAPDSTKHNGFEDANEFFNVTLMQCNEDGALMRSSSLGQSIAAWIASGHGGGAIEFGEGIKSGQGYVWVDKDACSSVCPHVPASTSFTLDDDLSEWDMSLCSY